MKAIAFGSPPGTENLALAGPALASVARALPGNRGKPAGTVSQIRPHSVSVWPAAMDADGVVDRLGGDDASPLVVVAGTSFVVAPADVVGEETGVPQAASRSARGSIKKRWHGRDGIVRV